MKKFFYIMVAVLLFTAGCEKNAQAENEIAADKLYFFYSDGCPHCHHAMDYINAKYKNKKLNMEKVDVATPEGYLLLFKCAEKFNLGRSIGTPLFCMGDNYLMGWSSEYESKFDAYAKPFLK